ncbi:MAG: PQQ-binding-like beta-propeller repeat protein [Verrucomicrobia bacterium]|nr:PQQ-binding-like beta-propeller repeat protein [Verrucomicrobiota bacterium]
MPASKVIFVGIKGTVLALDAASGEQVWSRHLKGGEFVNVLLDGDHLYASTHGEVFCLDPRTGQCRWHNKLPGMGWGLVSIATENGFNTAFLALMEEKRRREAASASAASTASTAAT